MADRQPLKDDYTEWAHETKLQKVPIYVGQGAWDVYPDWHYFAQEQEELLKDPQLPLLRRLGLPADVELAAINFSGHLFGPKYKKYRVEFFGTLGGIWIGQERPADIVADFRSFAHIIYPIPETPERNPPRYFLLNAWRGRIFMRDSDLFWERIWNTHTRKMTVMMCNVGRSNDPDPDLKLATADAIKLAPSLELFTLSRNLTGHTNSGRPPKAVATSDTIRAWWPQYNTTLDALKKELKRRPRGRQRLSKHPTTGRQAIIQCAIPGIDSRIAAKLAEFTSAADVALRYTGWRCSQIEIGTWETTRYREKLQESMEAHGVKQPAKRKGTN